MSLSARLRFLLLSSVLVLACLTGCGYRLSSLDVQIFDSSDHARLWTSGRISGQESYTGSGSNDPKRLEASYTALEEAVRKSADRLSDQF